MKKTMLWAALAACALGTGWALTDDSAGPPPKHGRWGLKAELAKLNLTAAQQQQVQEIFAAAKPALRSSMQQARDARWAVAATIRENPSDEAAVRTKAAQLGTLLTELSVQQARLHAQIDKVLTPEQVQQWNALQAEREARHTHPHGVHPEGQ